MYAGGGGMPAYNSGGGGAPVGSIRRQRGVDDDDVFMTGARTGTVNGVPRSGSGSINSDELGSPRQRARALNNTARQRMSSYRMEAPQAFGTFNRNLGRVTLLIKHRRVQWYPNI